MPEREKRVVAAGLAVDQFGIKTLRRFQLAAINATTKGKDVLVVAGTGSGKSICYQVPAIMKNGITLVIVPTLAIRMDQFQFLKSKGAVVYEVGANISGDEYRRQEIEITEQSATNPIILLGTPETFMGTDMSDGYIKTNVTLIKKHLRLLVFDECHLFDEWRAFRKAFGKMSEIRLVKPGVPMIALTATLLPHKIQLLQRELLQNPVEIRGSVNRPNVTIYLQSYLPPPSKKEHPKWKTSWENLANQVATIAAEGKGPAITYFSNKSDAEQLSCFLSQKGIPASCFTGNSTSSDKKQIHSSMLDGTIRIMCATPAYGLGIDLKNIRTVIRVGIPKNLSLWVQEQGRAGRDGEASSAVMLISEFHDLQRLTFWKKSVSDDETKNLVVSDFEEALRYVYAGISGFCMRKHQMKYFGEVPDDKAVIRKCSSGCMGMSSFSTHDKTEDLKNIQSVFSILQSRGIREIAETRLSAFLLGKTDKSLAKKLSTEDFQSSVYGCMSDGKYLPVLL